MCPCRVVNCLWGFVVGSMRLLLFFATILLVLTSVFNMVALYQLFNMYYEESPLSYSQVRVHLFTVFSLLVVLIGAFGAFCEHRASLKTFSTLAGLQGFIIIGLLFWANSAHYFQHANHRFLDDMKAQQRDYDWLHIDTEGPRRAATFAWDKMQYGTCCGILGPSDWDRFRPRDLGPDVYPASCCADFDFYRELDVAEKHLCRGTVALAQTGCKEKLDNNVRGISLYFMVYAVFLLVLAGVACCIRGHAEARRAEERQIVTQITIVPAPQVEKSPSALYPNLGYGSLT